MLSIPGVELGIRNRADATVLGLAAGVGIAFDLAARSARPGVAASLAVVAASVALIASKRLVSSAAIALAALAPLFGIWFLLRTSPWLLTLDLGAVLALLGAASMVGTLDPWDLRLSAVLERSWLGALHVLAAPAFLARIRRTPRASTPAHAGLALRLVRGVALALPLVLVVGVLLASADAVFASIVSPGFDAPSALAHVLLVAVGAWLWGGLARAASAVEPPPRRAIRPPLGAVEATAALTLLGVVLAIFVGVQLVALAGGARHVLTTHHLTYAEYARSGFFQLLAVGAIVLVAIMALRSATGDGDRRFTVAASAVAVLTLAVVAVAVRRLALYDDAYGLTVLRFMATVAAAWIGIVFVLLIASLSGLGASRRWLPAGAALSALALLLVVNVSDPERLIVRHDIEHAVRTGRVDVAYLSELSDDAVPALLGRADRLPARERDALRDYVCADPPEPGGWASWNAAGTRANRARNSLCAGRVSL